jgi:hypothetical protein
MAKPRSPYESRVPPSAGASSRLPRPRRAFASLAAQIPAKTILRRVSAADRLHYRALCRFRRPAHSPPLLHGNRAGRPTGLGRNYARQISAGCVKAIEVRLDIPELKAFRAALELDEEMRRDVASEVPAEVMRVEPGGPREAGAR